MDNWCVLYVLFVVREEWQYHYDIRCKIWCQKNISLKMCVITFKSHCTRMALSLN